VAESDIWDPDAYLRWPRPRTRGVVDLLSHIDHERPRLVIDLGCGPGNNTELIADRWPDAQVVGIDSSPSMINAARSRERPGHLGFRVGDLRDWRPEEPPDVVLASAVLQFIPGHVDLLSRWAGFLAPGGVLGLQSPAAARDSSDSIMGIAQEQIESPAWRELVGGSLRNVNPYEPVDYLTAMGDAGLDAEAWETFYSFPLEGSGSLAQYAAGSVIRPALSRLEPADLQRFMDEYIQRLRARQPVRLIGGKEVEILRQRRIFAVGRRP
jgi:trans-aconitate 2-methyltransferase